jgi:hypothetical protein
MNAENSLLRPWHAHRTLTLEGCSWPGHQADVSPNIARDGLLLVDGTFFT